jgi:DNA modification methylase
MLDHARGQLKIDPQEGEGKSIATPRGRDDSIHQWYQIIMGFDWELVDHVIDLFAITPDHLVLDPFCGSGTTLVQCKKRGISSVGIDANPVCTFATRVKTSWHLEPDELRKYLRRTVSTADLLAQQYKSGSDLTLKYLIDSGMIERGWLSFHKAKKVIDLRSAIELLNLKPSVKKFFNLALISAVIDHIADIKFGPELYCLSSPKRAQVKKSFVDTAERMIDDIEEARSSGIRGAPANIITGDSRDHGVLRRAVPKGADFVITSPPYPAEHDYTRNTRLELVLLGHVQDKSDLRPLKRKMVRCHTKGIYKDDTDARYAARYPKVQRIAKRLDKRAEDYTDGFSKLYGRMVREYFGGMICHLRSAMKVLRPGGRCAYVIRDQQSLLGVYIDTPKILAAIAQSRSQGFKLQEVIEWKKSRGSTGVRTLIEKIVILRKSD